MQGGEHATLLPESNLRLAVHSSRPLYGAGPFERKEGLDTFGFFSLSQTEQAYKKFLSRLSTRVQQRGNRGLRKQTAQ